MLVSLAGCLGNITPDKEKTDATSDLDTERKEIFNLAVASGYEGTYEEWLASIRGGSVIMQVSNGYIQWASTDENQWHDLLALRELTGESGKTSEFRVEDGYLQWKFVDAAEDGWTNLLELESLRGKDGHTPTIEISDDGYWVIDGDATDYYVGTKVENSKYLSEEEYRSQLACYGSVHMVREKTRIRIIFSTKMKAGTKITFLGNTSIYKHGISVLENNADKSFGDYVDTGWLTADEKVFTTEMEGYPVLTVARNNNAELTQEELNVLHSMFKVEGEKVNSYSKTGPLTNEEYKEQVAHWGSIPQPVINTRVRISFAVKMKAGTKITFVGDSSLYKWAVCEQFNTSSNSGLDLSWNTNWPVSTAPYITWIDGTYVVITLSKHNNAALTNAELAKVHSMFRVEGEKYVEAPKGVINRVETAVSGVAHRGYSLAAPENTLSAYRLAAQRGFLKAECDIRFTSDGIPVLLHDGSIDRTSNGTGNIASMTLAQARQYDYGSWKSNEFAGEQIPTFEEFIALCREISLHPYIEIKEGLTADKAQLLVSIVKKYGMLNKVSWISFGYDSLTAIKNVDANARLGYVVNAVDSTIITNALNLLTGTNEVYINCNYVNANDAAVNLCMNANLPLEVWTVNNPNALFSLNPYISGVSSDWIQAGQFLYKNAME